MKIWVDADACPGEIKEIILKAAHKRHIETIFVSNKTIYNYAKEITHNECFYIFGGMAIIKAWKIHQFKNSLFNG